MNAYFQLVIDSNGVGLKLVPATEGGSDLVINEVVEYLQMKKVPEFDVKVIFAAMQRLSQATIVPLTRQTMYQVQEMFRLNVSQDKMQATVRFYPPSSGGILMGKEEIVTDLYHQKIVFGISEASIDAFLKNREYCTDIVIATGKEPIHGTDASVSYFFNTDLNTKPTRNEDGSVDFFNLNTINHCKQGDILAKLVKAEPSLSGTDVTGVPIKGRDVKQISLAYGNNIECSEDKTEIKSKLNGHVSLIAGKVFVSDVLELDNVGTSTGNIVSGGSVLINQNVQAGFSIKAEGNVEVKGVVEGATIEAGGDIIIARGMNGMGKGELIAKGRVIAKFLENTTVTSGQYVEADSILHSNVNAKTSIVVEGRKGNIAGGTYRATNMISCKLLGSKMGADTVVEVGVDPAVKMRYSVLVKSIVEAEKNIKNMQPILLGATQKIKRGEVIQPEQYKYIQSLALASKQQQEQLVKDKEEFELVEAELNNRGNAVVCVRGEVYAGTKIVVSEASVTLKSTQSFCRFIYEQGDVKMTSF